MHEAALSAIVQKEEYSVAQSTAFRAVEEVASLVQPGWTEKKTARMLEICLRDQGVKSFFHKPFVWFGDRTKFQHVGKYKDFMPTDRALKASEVFILDVAPIVNGFACDVGYTDCLEMNPEFEKAQRFLKNIYNEIPKIFQTVPEKEIWNEVESRILDAGYENIHKKYPLSVLGHRVHEHSEKGSFFEKYGFGWQSYWGLLKRGVLPEVLAPFSNSIQDGLWAIEPHIGTPTFGAKFEEILVVENGKAYWINQEDCYATQKRVHHRRSIGNREVTC